MYVLRFIRSYVKKKMINSLPEACEFKKDSDRCKTIARDPDENDSNYKKKLI